MKEKMIVEPGEKSVLIEAVRVPPVRESYGNLTDLADSIKNEGLHHPVTLWSDGTLISGARRLRSYFKLSAEPGHRGKYDRIKAVFVDTIEAAAERLAADNFDEGRAKRMTPSEVCRLWGLLRLLDEPAAIRRADAARRRGVELRRDTLAGKRKPGRTSYTEDYFLKVLGPPFGMSESTATRLVTVYLLANGLTAPTRGLPPERSAQAVQAMKRLDAGESSIWAEYAALKGQRAFVSRPRPAAAGPDPAPAPKQLLAWSRSLPQLEGLVAGLVELGPPHPDLPADQTTQIHARLMTVRRDLEKMIKQLKGTIQS